MYSHSVRLEKEKCIGCTDCIKRCPTEAIRVRGSKAQIIEERCIDCGNCIRICRNGAKKAVTDDWRMLGRFKHRVALPAPSFYAQFPKAKSIEHILNALYAIGFTDVLEVGAAGEVIAEKTYAWLEEATHFPVISSSCPAIVRLIQRRFPSLIHQVLPIISPMELAARYVRECYKKQGASREEVGIFFLSPCPAKATEIRRPKGIKESEVDGVIGMQDIYKKVLPYLNSEGVDKIIRQTSLEGLKWARRTGGLNEVRLKSHLSVDGMDNVIGILEKVEDGTLTEVHYIEALACTGGCLGGALTVENPFVSRCYLQKWMEQDKKEKRVQNTELLEDIAKMPVRYEKSIVPRPVFSLDHDTQKAIEKMQAIEELYTQLPQIDCGSCGAPTCRCFAEDVVRHNAQIEECIFMFRKKVKELSENMHELTQTTLPTADEN
ncbi:[Fe-Fe] hydrogenase large subunit C-terminal domain-containing protein [Sporanaerobium hydrogeniformans]|uniref:[Fe-Fe] hydrogenase large subunit C-terminal domain-containing protein n=1 Tax=Sporanaerobium hydrogeniformans TaxID=3072179 RepID=UPI0015D4A089|nr:[Fe-Fe] hydrogenase large subunit C-terminal domain-containing protein [Sporanaerobium hydrogeniformans]